MVVTQGEVYWVDLRRPTGSEPGYKRPCVVVQGALFNASNIQTVVVCATTSNLNRALSPGNVLLQKGEANLPKKSVVNITQMLTLTRSALGPKIGTLSQQRIKDIVAGVQLLIRM